MGKCPECPECGQQQLSCACEAPLLRNQLTAALARAEKAERELSERDEQLSEALRNGNELREKVVLAGELIAVCNGDGGHYQAKHGFEQACRHAMERVPERLAEARAECARLEEKVEQLKHDMNTGERRSLLSSARISELEEALTETDRLRREGRRLLARMVNLSKCCNPEGLPRLRELSENIADYLNRTSRDSDLLRARKALAKGKA